MTEAARTSKLDIARAIAAQPDGTVADLVLFEHGTVIFLRNPSEASALAAAQALDAKIGPYGGEGSEFGDFNPMKLKAFDGWLVEFCWGPAVVTIVLPEDLTAPTAASSTEVVLGIDDRAALTVGLSGRAARNLDMRERKIVYRSWAAVE